MDLSNEGAILNKPTRTVNFIWGFFNKINTITLGLNKFAFPAVYGR
jgi:hypothetical protein